MAAEWYYATEGRCIGPLTLEQLAAELPRQQGGETLVYGPGLTSWTQARHVAALFINPAGPSAPPTPPAVQRRADEIEFTIHGDDLQFVEIELDPGETVVAEAGALMYMTAGVEMRTHLGDPSASQGLLGKVLSAGKRLLTGSSLFLTTFRGVGAGKERAAFAAAYPGKIIALDLATLGGELLCQKESFLCAARGVQIGLGFTRRFGAGLFGGEGFILQKLTGDGLAFVHAGGTIIGRRLAAGELLKVDTGCIVAFTRTVTYDIQFVGGIRNTLFGGEGLFFATLTGPGEVWLQSLPFVRLADRIHSTGGLRGKQTGEGSVLGRTGKTLGGR